MINENDISEEKKWFQKKLAEKALRTLEKNNINAYYETNIEDGLKRILEMIPEGASVGRADSVSLHQIGIIPAIEQRNKNTLINPYPNETGFLEMQERRRLQKEIFLADVFLTGTNAVTLDGKLVNIDGSGNRVAAMIFGPEKVIVVSGTNKIVKDVDEALYRIKQYCAPLNAKRHYMKHGIEGLADLPCVKTGRCANCKHDWKICRYTVIVDGIMAWDKGRINVVIIDGELGM